MDEESRGGNCKWEGQEGQRCGSGWGGSFGLKLKEKGKEMQLTWNHPSSQRTETQKPSHPGQPVCSQKEEPVGREQEPSRVQLAW